MILGVSMPFKRAGLLQRPTRHTRTIPGRVSMPFKRAGWLQQPLDEGSRGEGSVSMPFKRAGWLQPVSLAASAWGLGFNAL